MVLAKFTSRTPSKFIPVALVSDEIPWAVPYLAGDSPPYRPVPPPGTYKLTAKVSGYASVTLAGAANSSGIIGVAVSYNDYSGDGETFLNGFENVTTIPVASTVAHLDWFSDLVQTGPNLYATKKSSPEGFEVEIDVLTNIFHSNGTLTTTINGVVYEQPLNGA